MSENLLIFGSIIAFVGLAIFLWGNIVEYKTPMVYKWCSIVGCIMMGIVMIRLIIIFAME